MDYNLNSKHNHQSKKIKIDKTEAKPVVKMQSPINYMLLLQHNFKHTFLSNNKDYSNSNFRNTNFRINNYNLVEYNILKESGRFKSKLYMTK